MIPKVLALTLLFAWTPSVAQEMSGMGMVNHSDGAQIIVTVNPEARVSAVLGNAPLPSHPCGTPNTLQVKVINQDGVRSPLQARLVDAPAAVAMKWDDAALTGRQDEERLLQIRIGRNEVADLTVAFSLSGDPGDLASRDRVHFILKCL
jgi:hypothetical protein